MFHQVDRPVCILYAIDYSLHLYIAANRCQYFIERYNLVVLVLVIAPPILLPWSSLS